VHCKEILLGYGITDVEIAFCESTYTRYSGPRFLDHVSYVDPTFDVRVPFTPALGLQIVAKAFPYLEGTGCPYRCEGRGSNRVFVLTACHVVLPPSKYSNEPYHRKINSTHRLEVIHISSRAFQNTLEALMDDWSLGLHGRPLRGRACGSRGACRGRGPQDNFR